MSRSDTPCKFLVNLAIVLKEQLKSEGEVGFLAGLAG